jgi:ribosomal protein S27AE
MPDNSFSICPNCGSEFMLTDNQESGEFMMICSDCGYMHCKAFKRAENGNFILKDDTLPPSFDNLIPLEDIIENPFGAWVVKLLDSEDVDGGSLANEDEFNEFIKLVEMLKEDNAAEYARISRLIDGEIVVTHYIDTPDVNLAEYDDDAETEK